MSRPSFSVLGGALGVSLSLNLVLLFAIVAGRAAPTAFGQAVDHGDGFVMATEQASDGSAVSFILDTREPRLLTYRIDPSGQLQLTNAREMECDLKLVDFHVSKSQPGKAQKTSPAVRDVRKAVEDRESRSQGDPKEKKETKEAKDAKDEPKEKAR